MSFFPEILKEKKFKNYGPQSPQQAAALRVMQGIAEHAEEVSAVRGILLHGPFGTGKTHLQAATYNALEIEDDRKLWLSPIKDGEKHPLTQAFLYGDKNDRAQFDSAEAIFFDEFTIASTKAGVAQAIITFLNLAYERNLKLFLSSNHSLEEVAERIKKASKVVLKDGQGNTTEITELDNLVSGRIQSRLIELLTPIEVLGNDYRKVLAKRGRDQVGHILGEELKRWESK